MLQLIKIIFILFLIPSISFGATARTSGGGGSGSGTNYWSIGTDNVSINTTYNVGINSVNPTQKLDVVGTGKFDSVLVNGAGSGNFFGPNGFKFDPNNSTGTGLNPAIYVLNTGNVGIGTSSSAPLSPFQVTGNSFFSNIGGSAISFNLNGSNFGHIYSTTGDSTIYFGGTSNKNDAPTGVSTFNIDFDTTNVGLSTDSAREKLDIVGTVRMTGLKLTTNPSSGYVLVTNSVGVGTWMSPASIGAGGGSGSNPTATVGTSAVNGVSTSFMRADGAPAIDQTMVPTWTGLHTFNKSPISIVTSNNVGIGTATPPNVLYVAGTMEGQGFKLNNNASSGYILVTNSVGVGTWMSPSSIGAGGGSGTINSGTTSRVSYYSGATTLDSSTKIFNDNTNVGIGTIAPRTSVEIGVQTMNINGTNVGIGSINPEYGLVITANGAKVTGTGTSNFTSNVGINSASPSHFLDVTGGTVWTNGGFATNVGIGTSGTGATSCLCKTFSFGICTVIGTCT